MSTPGAPGDLEAGPYLDRMIELRLFGRKPVGAAPSYSTDDAAAERLLAHLNRPPLRWMAIREDDGWTFAFRQLSDTADPDSTATRYVRLVSAKAPTRPLAICHGVEADRCDAADELSLLPLPRDGGEGWGEGVPVSSRSTRSSNRVDLS
jgi:hypothetical protein